MVLFLAHMILIWTISSCYYIPYTDYDRREISEKRGIWVCSVMTDAARFLFTGCQGETNKRDPQKCFRLGAHASILPSFTNLEN